MRPLAFVNGRVFTGRSQQDVANGFRVARGSIAAVGTMDGAGDSTVIDLEGRTVLPAFLDVHTHPPAVAMTVRDVPCIAPHVTSIPAMIEALGRHHEAGRSRDGWIEGWGYDESKLVERRTPTARDLDLVSETHPVCVMRSDLHSAVCNTVALRLAGITRDTQDPEGGRFGRDVDGQPNGLLLELGAVDAVRRVKSAEGFEERVSAIRTTSGHFVERGIVAVSDMMASTRPVDDLQVYRAAAARGFLPRASLYFSWADLERQLPPDLTDEQRTGDVRFAGIKMFADGSISGRTAWMREPYAASNELGMSTLSAESMQAGYEWARRNRVQIAVHAMGDRALDTVIEFFADKDPWMADGVPSVRLEHATLLSDAHLARIAAGRMRFGIATQIIFSFAEHDSYVSHLTPAQFAQAYRLKTWFGTIECLGLSSDAPATPWGDPDNVFVSIQAAVTRRACDGRPFVPDQALTVQQAVLLYTSRAATVGPYEDLGQIAPGFDASFVVLDRDIFAIEPSRIHETRVVETWIRGERVFQR
jgi:predicted amidohydrolase YtcJ